LGFTSAAIRTPPNQALEPTAYSVRCAPASGGGSPRAFGCCHTLISLSTSRTIYPSSHRPCTIDAWTSSTNSNTNSKGVEFEWDEEKARSNIANHGVTFEEAAEVFFDPFYQGG
jgi:hypothetical protein